MIDLYSCVDVDGKCGFPEGKREEGVMSNGIP